MRLWRWLAICLTLTLLSAVGLVVSRYWQSTPAQTASPEPFIRAEQIGAVSALGRLEPKGEVIRLSAPAGIEPARVKQLLVKRGDRVYPGDVIAILDTRDRLQAALTIAQTQVEMARARLNQVKAGAKQGALQAQATVIKRSKAELTGELAAKDAQIERLVAEHSNALLEYNRHAHLFQEGAVSASLRDSKQLTLDMATKRLLEARHTRQKLQKTLQEQIQEARSTLANLAEVRPTDVSVAQAALRNAQAGVAQARANLAQAYVRAPQAGQVLQVYTRPGEAVGPDGVVSLGETGRMFAIAEVYATDIHLVKPGQRVTITSRGFPNRLHGTVEEVGLQVAKKDLLNTDPAADVDARVVEVKIWLQPQDSQKVAGLTNLQVQTVINIRE